MCIRDRRDAKLIEREPWVFRRDRHGRLVSPHATDPRDSTERTVWGDLAELDYVNGRARDFLVGYWDRQIARLQALGISGFRCDAAHKVPTCVWRRLIEAARARRSRCLFVAETLGCTPEETRSTASAGFDFLLNSFAWWDLDAPWALEQYEALRLAAPSIAFPESHDTPRFAATLGEEDAGSLARALVQRYGLAAFFSTGVLMPIGYEWGYRRPLDVVLTRPDRRESTPIDISADIAALNRLRAALPASNVEGAQVRLSAPERPYLALLRLDSGHGLAARHGTLVVANRSSVPAGIDAGSMLCAAGGYFDSFVDVTPCRSQTRLEPGESLTLAPGELRVFAAAAPPDRKRTPPYRDPSGEGRVLIENVWPEMDCGATAVKRIVGEALEVWADIISDGHDAVGVELIYRAADERDWRRAPMRLFDNDRWVGSFLLERNIRYFYTIEAWRDPFTSWCDEIRKKMAAAQDVHLETVEGLRIAKQAKRRARGPDAVALGDLVTRIGALPKRSPARSELLLDDGNVALVRRYAEREDLSRYGRELEVVADRLAARFSAWYELFPRSQSGDPTRHGTFADVMARLPYVREMGFDVLYFPPIHPIGRSNRKGRNNAPTAEPGDLGSVYAIGSPLGGHDAIHPELGTLAEFRRLVSAAHAHGLEIALDFAVQCSPDHPWIKEHPEWFDWRPDGTLKYAENPPKKYEDIVNVHFYGASLPSLWLALRSVVLFWAAEGVRIFRVDNPHTKPLPFWRWLIREVNEAHPDVIFLSEAFTRPKMMKALAKIGFQQSYTYFTWRETKQELMEYVTELASTEMAEYYRPNFFTNTPDINPHYLQAGGRAAFLVRATLAATLSSAWGIYSGFELCEAAAIPGREEYRDSEKYELRAWDWDRPGHIRAHICALNAIRRENTALQDFRGTYFLNAWNEEVLAYARMTPARDSCLIVLVNLDPLNRQECSYEVPLWDFGLPDDATVEAEDLLQGGRFALHGKIHRIALDPAVSPVMIWRLRPPKRRESWP